MSQIIRQRPVELVPNFINGTWRKPKFSAMKRANLRKGAILRGEYVRNNVFANFDSPNRFFVGADLSKGQWDPYWDKVPSFQVMKAPKGAKYELNIAERVSNIQKSLLWTPIKMKELKDERDKEKHKTPWEKFFLKHKLI